MQMGEKEPADILSADEDKFQELLNEEEWQVMEAKFRLI